MKHLIVVLSLLLASPVWAVLPDEILSDPVLESRARTLSQELRCVVCQGENIDESNAQIARGLRLLVRERLTEGDSDQQVLNYIVARYGEYVLMRPTWGGANIILYTAGPLMLLFGLLTGFNYLRRRSADTSSIDVLTNEEENRLAKILQE